VRIAVDAMGGDNAPAIQVEGALAAAREADGAIELVLVGKQALIEAELAARDHSGLSVSIVDADDVITMAESPAQAVRKKRGASLIVATGLLKSGDVGGLVSAGNTGAVVASSLLGLGMLKEVRRPAIASLFPTAKETGVLLDVGASVDSRPRDLLEFAVMGEVYARHVLGRDEPRVALMNIGEESTKGSELTQEAHRLLAQATLNFAGNLEGRNLLRGNVDVVVCDGFVGNVVLKLIEGLIDMLSSAVGGDFKGVGLDTLARQLDYAEYGGAPLLGVNGTVIIAHGSSSAKAIKNAVRVAARFVDTDLDHVIADRLREVVADNGR
jgi:glycerol-3-phosphate acyltransferase PlsX